MGLIKDFIEFRKTKKKEKFLASLGLTLEDEPYLAQAVKYIKNQTPINEEPVEVVKEASNGSTEVVEKKPNQKMTPEEFVEQFTGEVEEFYPYGRDA